MDVNTITSASAAIGRGFFGGLLLGYAPKKVFKLTVVVARLFLAGLAYLRYRQLASFNQDRIKGTVSTMANATSTFNNYNVEALAMKLGFPLTNGMSAGFAIGFYERLKIKMFFNRSKVGMLFFPQLKQEHKLFACF